MQASSERRVTDEGAAQLRVTADGHPFCEGPRFEAVVGYHDFGLADDNLAMV
jgi:hypothetical protein